MDQLVPNVPDARLKAIVADSEAIATAANLTHEHVKTLANNMADLAASHLAQRELLVKLIENLGEDGNAT